MKNDDANDRLKKWESDKAKKDIPETEIFTPDQTHSSLIAIMESIEHHMKRSPCASVDAEEIAVQAVIFGSYNFYEALGIIEQSKLRYVEIWNEIHIDDSND